MMTLTLDLTHLSDQDLLTEIKRRATHERDATASLIASLMELDARRLYRGEGCASLFTYCTQVLHLSEHAAYLRMEAARAARRFPVLLQLLAEGAIHLTAIRLLAPHLTPANHAEILEEARHKSKRDVEEIVARLQPRPAVPASVRKLPESKAAAIAQAATPLLQPACDDAESGREPVMVVPPKRPAEVKAIAPEQYKVQFTVSRETHDKLRRAQDLLRHTIPNGDPAAIFDKALTLLIDNLEKAKLAATDRPRQKARAIAPQSRHIPAAVRRAVWKRDGGRCTFIGTQGRCGETGFLEHHHAVPFAAGGQPTIDNVCLLRRAHNMHEAERYFGRGHTPLLRETRVAYGVESPTRSGSSSG